jgi:3-hydroxyacyl-[acyl-carrier-protein] dehydratase
MGFLKNNFFYKIIKTEIDENNLKYNIQINKNHQIFDGHFPNNPIMPGVCTFQIVKELIQDYSNIELILTKASNIKFIDAINPILDDYVEYQITYSVVENVFQTNAIILQKNIPVFKFSGNYKVVI